LIGTKMNDFDLEVSRSSTIALYSTLNISETVRDRGPPIGNGIWGIKLSRDRWRHVTLKGQTRYSLRAQYPK